MSWDKKVELYVQKKTSVCSAGEVLAFFPTQNCGSWEPHEVKDFAKRLNEFNKEVQKLVKETNGEGICIRTNT